MGDTLEGTVVAVDPTTGQPINPNESVPVVLTKARMQGDTSPGTYQIELTMPDGFKYYVDAVSDTQYAVYVAADNAHKALLRQLGALTSSELADGETIEARNDAVNAAIGGITSSATALADSLFIPLVKGFGNPVSRTDDEKRRFILPEKQEVVRTILAQCVLGFDAQSFLDRSS